MSTATRLLRHGRELVRQEGVALIEFALVLPLLLLLVLGVIDFGKAFNYKNDETHLANQAARYAAVNSCTGCGGQTDNHPGFRSRQPRTNSRPAWRSRWSSPTPPATFPASRLHRSRSRRQESLRGKTGQGLALLRFFVLALPRTGHFHHQRIVDERLEKDWAGAAGTGVHSAGSVYDVEPNSASNDTC